MKRKLDNQARVLLKARLALDYVNSADIGYYGRHCHTVYATGTPVHRALT